jgi:hypothetical protein
MFYFQVRLSLRDGIGDQVASCDEALRNQIKELKAEYHRTGVCLMQAR